MEDKSKRYLKRKEAAERIRRLAIIDLDTKELDIKISYETSIKKNIKDGE